MSAGRHCTKGQSRSALRCHAVEKCCGWNGYRLASNQCASGCPNGTTGVGATGRLPQSPLPPQRSAALRIDASLTCGYPLVVICTDVPAAQIKGLICRQRVSPGLNWLRTGYLPVDGCAALYRRDISGHEIIFQVGGKLCPRKDSVVSSVPGYDPTVIGIVRFHGLGNLACVLSQVLLEDLSL